MTHTTARPRPDAVAAIALTALLSMAAASPPPKGAPLPGAKQSLRDERLPGLDPKVWRTDYNKAVRQAVHAKKPFCLFFFRHISHCRKVAQAMNASPTASENLRGWVCIQVNEWRLKNKELNENYNIDVVPQIVLVSPEGLELTRFNDIALLDIATLTNALARWGEPKIRVTDKSPQADDKDIAGNLRLIFHQAANVDHRDMRLPPIGGETIYDFTLGNPDAEKEAGVEVVGWSEPEEQDGAPCRNTDQTGVGDGKGGFAYITLPIENPTGGYRVILDIWGKSFDPNTRYRTWLKNIRVRIGPGKTDWRTFHFKKTEYFKTDRYNEFPLDFPADNLPIYNGALTIGMGEGDQQIWISRVRVLHFPEKTKAPTPTERGTDTD